MKFLSILILTVSAVIASSQASSQATVTETPVSEFTRKVGEIINCINVQLESSVKNVLTALVQFLIELQFPEVLIQDLEELLRGELHISAVSLLREVVLLPVELPKTILRLFSDPKILVDKFIQFLKIITDSSSAVVQCISR